MTVYLRPLNLEHSSGIYSEFKLDIDDIQLLIQKSQYEDGAYSEVRRYDISELQISQHSKKQQKFISYAAKFWLKFSLKSKVSKFENRKQASLQLSELIQISTFTKNDIRTRFLSIGDYKLAYQFRCNRFLQVCGETLHKSLAIYSKRQENVHELSPLKMAVFKDLQPNGNPLHRQVSQANEIGIRSQGSDFPLRQIPNNEREMKKSKQVLFYKGPCENSNMFSCLDGEAETRKQKQFQMIQQPYD